MSGFRGGDVDDEYGEFTEIIKLRMKVSRLEDHGLGNGAVFILPVDMFVGATAAYGLPIVRADVPKPMLGLTDE